MSDIFISYASEDKPRVEVLARELERKGWSVWWDRRIPIGRSFDEVIEEALDASRAVVVVWTATSVKSQWVKNEAREGLRRRVLFPVMLLEAVKIPLEFRDVQTAHLMDWQPEQEHQGFEQFLDDLALKIGVPLNRAAQPPPVMQNEEPVPAPASSTPEPEIEPLPTSVPKVEVDVSGDDRESVRSSEDRTSQSTGTGQSTESLPYLPIGLGILAVIGALVYFVVFSQGPSPVKRDVVSYQSTVQPPTTRPEVITPTTTPELNRQPASATTQEKPTAKQRGGSAKTITGNDGAPMVLVPAGEFTMGSRGEGTSSQNDEQPAHQVYLDAYYIDQYEVTTARYAKFFKAANRRQPEYWSANVVSDHARKPVVGVDWDDAVAYCAWAGKRLPTEAEWEKAARGTDQRLYPWGNAAPDAQRANFNRGYDFKDYGVLADVGSLEGGKSPYGACDMAGNVWEWTADWYDAHYYGKSPERNPKGPSSGEYRVLRGGSWGDAPDNVRSALRFWNAPSLRKVLLGSVVPRT